MRLLLLLAFVLGPAALAQPAVPTGTWTGALEWGEAEPVPLTAGLEECAEGLEITLASEDGAYRSEEVVRVEGERYHFAVANVQRGYTLACALAPRADGSLAGMCETEGTRARLELQPPARATIGCSE